ncbi:hypothetical protein EDB80DRAFT_713424 [Ilyonectria destructans]|nr:hypothetical protein EDB80DRAFT_713424 [Ilyonectria destructans]
MRDMQLSTDPAVTNYHERWLSSCMGGILRATNPKDHIYATLGLTRINMTPHYEGDFPVWRVYRDSVATWLEDFYSSPGKFARRTEELFFLTYSGTGICSNPLGLPTWAPNFPEHSRHSISAPGKLWKRDEVDQLFPSPAAPVTIIHSYTLRCEAL